jgi:hypothetical protein
LNYDLIFVLGLDVVVIGGGFSFGSPLLPLSDSGPGAKGEKVPSYQQGLETRSIRVLEGNNKGGGGAC